MADNHLPDTGDQVRAILNAEIRMATIGVQSVEACMERIEQLEKEVEAYRDANVILAKERNYAAEQCRAHMKRIVELESRRP